jgi:hypothetical protein
LPTLTLRLLLFLPVARSFPSLVLFVACHPCHTSNAPSVLSFHSSMRSFVHSDWPTNAPIAAALPSARRRALAFETTQELSRISGQPFQTQYAQSVALHTPFNPVSSPPLPCLLSFFSVLRSQSRLFAGTRLRYLPTRASNSSTAPSPHGLSESELKEDFCPVEKFHSHDYTTSPDTEAAHTAVCFL